jgi:RNA polymerase sigma-70 factor (ECF subfamily)
MWDLVGESAAGPVAASMVELRDNALPQPPAAGVGHTSSASAPALDEIMDRYARGDDAVFDELYRRGAPRVRGFLIRLCGDPALADDLTQEAFLRVHRARGGFVAGAPALPWMLAIARNAFLDQARRAHVRQKSGMKVDPEQGGTQAEAPPGTRGDEVLAAREMLDVVRATLEAMPMPHREAFVLIRFEGLSVSEAAQILGATEGAVKIRAFRAYEALRTELDRATGGVRKRP